MDGLRLVSINIERSKRLDLVCPFLEKEKADVVCIQELMQQDIDRIAQACGAQWHRYAPMGQLHTDEESGVFGVGIFARTPVVASGEQYYVRVSEAAPAHDPRDSSTFNKTNRLVVWADIPKGDATFRIATTHFTWSPKGAATNEQRTDIRHLLDILDTLGEFALCGDFNAPRGGEIFGMLAGRYADNIPSHYATSIDISLHRAGKDRPHELADKMVDGLFSTAGYQVSDVDLVSGVSDHCAVIATIAKILTAN